MTKHVNMKDLVDPVRAFLLEVDAGDVALITDDTEQIRYSVVGFREASDAERQRAWQDIRGIQQKVGRTMAATGRTEDQLDQLLQHGD